MKQRSSWRQHLFGSIEGQLKLATGLVLLLGFSIASLGTLLVTRQNLIHDLEADSASIKRSITGEAKALIALPTLERNRRLLQARERQTNWKHTVWLELADGTDLLPSHSEGSVPPEVIWELVAATTLRPPRWRGKPNCKMEPRFSPCGRTHPSPVSKSG